MTLKTLLPTVLAFALAGGLAIWGATVAVGQIERHSVRQVAGALQAAGHGWVRVAADGLMLSMRGVAPDEATRFRALTVAGEVVDSARVIDAMTIAATDTDTAPRFSVEILRGDDGVSLIGLIPAGKDRDALLEGVARAAFETPITDLLEVASYPAPAGWDDAVAYGIAALGRLSRAKVSIAADAVAIQSMADSPAERSKLEQALNATVPEGLALTLKIAAPRPVITPFTTRFVLGPDGARFDACAVPSAPDARRVIAAARAAGLAGEGACTVALGVPTADWTPASVAAIKALAALGGGTVTLSDVDVTLVAPRGTERTSFDDAVARLTAALPDVFTVKGVLPDPAPDGTAAPDMGPPEFVATRSPEGAVQLRGRVRDARARAAIGNYARALYGADRVTDGVRLDEGLPSGWSPRVMAGIDALSLLANGALTVTDDAVDLRGVSGLADAPAEIARRLSESLGQGSTYEIDVRYDRQLDPLLGLPTPDECVASVNRQLAAQKIAFAPGSDTMEAGARDTVDRIAEILRKCETSVMEIAGYTDSQGREVMNRDLSQARAMAVLTALAARRVPVSNLTARGYGEESPVGDNKTPAGREANRRIEFRLMGTTAGDPSAVAAAEADADADAALRQAAVATDSPDGTPTEESDAADTTVAEPAAPGPAPSSDAPDAGTDAGTDDAGARATDAGPPGTTAEAATDAAVGDPSVGSDAFAAEPGPVAPQGAAVSEDGGTPPAASGVQDDPGLRPRARPQDATP